MSFLVTAPAVITTAAENLAGIGSTLAEATAAAAAPTTGIAAAAADEVSAAITELFGGFAQEFQAISTQAATFHEQFVGLLQGGASAYLGAELASAPALLAPALPGPAAVVSANAYEQLVVNTNNNLQSLFTTWLAKPAPLLQQFIANQRRYSQWIAADFNSFVANFPANLANAPAAVEAGIQGLVTFPYASYTQQFISTEIAYVHSFISHLNNAANGIWIGLPAFGQELQSAFHTALAGDYYGAVKITGTALTNLMITGFDTSNYTVNFQAGFPTFTGTATAFPVPLGPLPEFFNAIGVLGQNSQYLTNLTSPAIPKQMMQNSTNALVTLSNPSIEALATLEINLQTPSATGTLSGFFGLPLVLSYSSIGPVITTLDGLATSATAVQQSLLSGDYLGALGAVLNSPAVVTNSFLNATVIEDVLVGIPTGFTSPFPTEVLITLHLPFDGILVPPHHVTATVNVVSDFSIPGIPFEATIFGTPFMGVLPMWVNYLPQQLATAIAFTG